MKLISMTDFVLGQEITIEVQSIGEQWSSRVSRYNKISSYANFLKRPLELWMFVPCDEDGNILEEPSKLSDKKWSEEDVSNWGGDCYEYQQAKVRCLFEGWNPIAKIDITICVENELKHRLFFPNCMTIENIVYTNTQLTATAIKQIGCDH